MARAAKVGRPAAVSDPVPAPARAPRRRTPHRGWLLATTALLPIAAGPVAAQTLPSPTTGPTGGQVTAGQASIARGAGNTTITQGTDRAAIDWQQFNVGSQHTVQFVQPGAGSWTLNRVVTPDPSVIAGRVQANGGVAIVNQSGVVFAQGAQVNVSSLIASAAGISNENFMAGRMVFDQAPRPGARVENHGSITVADRGLAALVAPGVSNSGVIRARLGRVALGAAETFVLDLAGDGLINIDVTQAVRQAPDGNAALVTNSGVIEAQGGSVLLTAHAASGLVEDLVRQTGTISAQTVGDRTGQVALRAEGGGARVDGTIDVTGGAAQRGGSVAVQATGAVTVSGTARIDASGGAAGGRVLVGTTGRGRNQAMAARTTVEAGAVVRADATQAGQGGEIVVNSTEGTEMRGTLSARGGASGGNGGFIEVSGQQALLISGFIDLSAPSGTPGELLLDPQNIIVSSNSNVNPPGGGSTVTDHATTPGANFTASTGNNNQWLRVDPSAITGFTGTVTLDAGNDIVVDSAINKTNGGLGLTAGNSITISANVSVSGALTLAATAGSIAIGADLRAASMTMTAGTGINQTGGTIASISGVGTALPLSATTAAGNISLMQAGNGSLALTFAAPGTVAIRSGDFANGQSGGTAGAIEIAGASSGGGITLEADRQNNNDATVGTGTIAVNAALTSTAGISLNADGAITQNASGTIVTARDATGILRIRNRTGGNATAAGSATLDQAANQVAVLDARTTGALAVSSIGFAAGPGDVPPANPTMTVTLAEGGSVSLTAPRLALPNGAIANTGDVTLVATEAASGAAATLTIGGAVTAVDEGTVRLRADRMALTGASFDGTGNNTNLALLEVGPQTAGRAVQFGGADNAASLWLGQTGVLTGADTTTLRIGQTSIAGAAGTVTGGDILVAGALTFGGTLALSGTGAVTQTAALTTNQLRVRGATDADGAGSVTLTDAGNAIAGIDVAATGTVDIATTGALTVSGARGSSVSLRAGDMSLGDAQVTATGASGRVTLRSAGAITQTAGGAIVAPELAAEALAGNTALTSAGNQVGTLANALSVGSNGPLLANDARGLYASGTINLVTQGALTIAGAVEARGGAATLTAGSIAIGAPVAVSGGGTPALSLTANGSGGASGNITQTQALLATAGGTLAVTASGNATLSLATNGIATLLASSAGGTFAYRTSGALTVGGAVSAATSLALTAGSTLTVNGALTTTNAGTITLSGTDLVQAALIRPRGAAATSGGTVNLQATSGAITQAAGGRIVAGTVSVSAPGAVNLQAGIALGAGGTASDWNAISRLTANVSGNFSLLNAGDLTFQGSIVNVAPAGTATLQTAGLLTLDAGSTVRANVISLATSSGIDILGALGGAGTGIINLRSGGAPITEGAGGSITTSQLRITAGGDVTLMSAANAIQGVAASGILTDIAVAIRSNVALSTIATADQMLFGNNTFGATPSGIRSNDITLWAPSITFGAGAPLQRFDTNAPGSVVLITDALNTNGQAIAVGDGGLIGLAANDPTTEVLVGDIFTSPPALPVPQLAPYTYSIVPDTSGNTLWISGAYLNSIIAGGTTNATLQVGRADQTARTFVIGDLAPSSTFGTFRLLGGDVIIGADITAPGRTVEIVAGTGNVLSSGTYTQIVTQYLYDPSGFFFPGYNTPPYGSLWSVLPQVAVASNGVITAGTLSVSAPNGNVSLGTVAHSVGALSGDAAGTFNFRNAGGFVVGPAGSGGIAGGTSVTLRADAGNITQAAGSPIDTPALSVVVPNGALVLDGGSAGTTAAADLNRIDSLVGTFNAAGGITIRNDGSLALSTLVDAATGDVTLHTQTGNITQPSSTIVANTLRVSAPAGSVTLNNGTVPATNTGPIANEIVALGASTVAGDLVLRNFQTLNITGPVLVGTAAGGTNGTATLVSRFGSIVQQAGGSLAADALTAATPGGSVLLNGATTNSVGTLLVGSAGADFRLFTDQALTIAGAITGSGGTVDLRSTGDLGVNAAVSGASVNLQAGGAITTAATVAGGVGGTVSMLSTGTLGLAANVTGGTIALTSGGAMTVGANVTGTSIALQGAGITLGSGGAGGTLTANRVLLRTGADFDPATGSAGGPSITQTAGTIEAAQFSASAPGGDITLNATGNTFGTIVAGADAGGAAAAAGIVAGGNVTLTTDGTLTIASPLLAGWDPARTEVTVTLRANQMALGALVDTRGPGGTNRQSGIIDIAPLTASNPITLGGISELGGNYLSLQASELANLRAGTVNITTTSAAEGIYVLDTAAMAAGTTLNLSAANGYVDQFPFATGTAQLAVDRLNVLAGGYVNLSSAANLIGEVTGLSAGGLINLASASPLLTLSGAVASSLSGTTITIRANDLAIGAGGSITVPSGIVDISGVTAGRAISLGTEVANTLGLSSAEIARIGQTTNPLTLVRIGDATSGTITVQGDVSFRDAPVDASSAVGGVRALALSLRTNTAVGDITQTGAGGINVATVSAVARQVSLASAGNAVDTIGALTGAGGGAALRSSRDLSLQSGITASATGGTLAITSDGTLTVAGNAQTTGATGDVALTGGTGLSIGAASAVSSVGGVTLAAGPTTGDGIGTLTVSGTVAAAGDIAASATGTLTVAQDLVSTGGNIALSTRAPGTQPAADIVIVAPSPVGPNLGTDPTVTEIRAVGAGAGNVTLTATGAISQALAGTQIVANSLQVLAGTNVDLGPAGNQITELRSLSAGGAATLNVQNGLLITGLASAAGQLSLTAGTTLTVAGTGTAEATGSNSVLTLTSGTAMTIQGAASAETVDLTATGGPLAITGGTVTGGGPGSGGGVTLAGTSLTIDGGATVTGETITANLATGTVTLNNSTVTALGPAGVLSLATGGAIGVTGGTVGGNTVTLDAGVAGLTVAGATLTGGSGGIALLSDGATLLSGGTTTVTGGTLTVQGQASAQIDGGTHAASTGVQVASAGGPAGIANAAVSSSGGAVTISGTTAAITGGSVSAGTAVGLTATAGNATIGNATVGAGTNITLTANAGQASVTGGGLTAGGEITLQGGTLAQVSGGSHTAGGDVRLASAGGGAAIVSGANVTSTTGAVALGGTTATIAGNLVQAGTDITATATAGAASVTAAGLTAGRDIVVQGVTGASIAGGTHTANRDLRLTATGAGSAVLGTTTVTAATGTVALTGVDASIGTSTVQAGTDVTLTASGQATVTGGGLTAGGNIVLQGGSLAQISGGTHGAGAGVSLSAAGGAANILSAGVTATGGSVSLAGASATISGATVGASANVALTGGTAGISASTVTAGSDVTLTGSGGQATITNGGVTAGRDIAVQGGTLAQVSGGSHAAARDISLTATAGSAQALGTTLTATGGTLSLTGTGAVMSGANLAAGTGIALTGTAGGVTTTNGSLTSGGGITLAAAGTATLSGTVTAAGGTTSITGQGGATISGGSHTGGAGFAVAAPAGTVQLNATSITSGAGAPISATGARAEVNGGQVTSGGSLQVTATAGDAVLAAPTLTAATTLGLNATGTVQVQPGTTASAGTDLSIGAGSLIVTAAALSAGQDIAMNLGGGATFTEASVFAGRDIRLDAGGFTTITRGKFDAANEIALSAGGFSFDQANIDPLIIRIEAVNNIAITGSSLTADELIRIAAGGTLTITDSTITANALGVSGGGGLLLERGLYIIRDVVVFASPTSIETVGRIVVRPRGTRYPGVAFDTRAAGATPDPLDVILPDDPNLPASQQPTQVRAQNTEGPGDFGVPTANAAGTLDFEIDAGRSAIFLLIDGGDATGDINTAGRVGIFGTGGRVTLTGTLVDFQGNQFSGGNATALTDSARPAGGEALARFTFNSCVVSSVNCFVPQQVITIPQAPPQQVDISLFGSRITDPDVQIPNVAEEDY